MTAPTRPRGTCYADPGRWCRWQPMCRSCEHLMPAQCSNCGATLTQSCEERTSGLCLRCLNGPVPS